MSSVPPPPPPYHLPTFTSPPPFVEEPDLYDPPSKKEPPPPFVARDTTWGKMDCSCCATCYKTSSQKCSACYSSCGRQVSKCGRRCLNVCCIVSGCFHVLCGCELECDPKKVALKVAVAISLLALVFGIFFGCVYPTILDRQFFQETTCVSLNFTRAEYRACEIQGCSCSECPLTFYSICDMDQFRFQSVNRSSCCGGSQCCATCCDTCSYTTCSGSGSSRSCTTHTYSCNCRCCSAVSHTTCAYVCGQKNDFDVTYFVTATNGTFHYSTTCGIERWDCVQGVETEYDFGTTWPCWYDTRNPDRVRFSPVASYNIAAIVFVGIFGFMLIIWTIVSVYCF
jgi:hypothetical protein